MNNWIRQFLCGGMRKKFVEQMKAQPKVNRQYPDVQCVSDIDYGAALGKSGDPDYRMDRFCGGDPEKRRPIVINIHGGGLMTGSKEFDRAMCVEFAAKGFLTYAITYPKIPEHSIEEILRAVVTAIRTIVRNAEKENGDPKQVFIVGDSAGAFLTVYAAAIIHDPRLAEEFGVPTDCDGIRISALGLISGMFYTAAKDKYGLFYKAMLYGRHNPNSVMKRYSDPETPIILDALPPCVLVTSDGDFLKEYSVSYYSALKKHGIDCRLLTFADERLVHDFPAFQCDLPAMQDAVDVISTYFTDCMRRN